MKRRSEKEQACSLAFYRIARFLFTYRQKNTSPCACACVPPSLHRLSSKSPGATQISPIRQSATLSFTQPRSVQSASPFLRRQKSPIGSREAARCIENIRTTELNEEMLFLAPALPLRHSPSSTKGERGEGEGERESFSRCVHLEVTPA